MKIILKNKEFEGVRKNMKKRNNKILGATMLSVLAVVFIAGLLFNMQVTEPIIKEQNVKEKEWHVYPVGDMSGADGTTFFCYIMLYPHPASDPISVTYASNLSNASAYEYADCINCSMTGETPYNTAFDIALKFEVDGNDTYNVTGSTWMDSWIRCYYNETGLSISSLLMSEVTIGTDGSNTKWMHFVANNSGSGYQSSKGQSYNGAYKLEIYG